MSQFEKRTVVVTGAGGALGAGVALAFADAGADVIAVDRRAPDLPGTSSLAADLTDPDAVRALFDGIDIPWAVIHTVGGFAPHRSLTDLDAAELHLQITLNLTTSALVTANALRVMSKAKAGRIVLTGSRAATHTAGNGFAYSVSKAAVLHLARMAAQETAGTGITVNCVAPSIIDTPANRKAMPGADYDAWPKVPELAGHYLFLADPAHNSMSGNVLDV